VRELKNTITEPKNALEGFCGRLHEAEVWISELEDRLMESNLTEYQKYKKSKSVRTS